MKVAYLADEPRFLESGDPPFFSRAKHEKALGESTPKTAVFIFEAVRAEPVEALRPFKRLERGQPSAYFEVLDEPLSFVRKRIAVLVYRRQYFPLQGSAPQRFPECNQP